MYETLSSFAQTWGMLLIIALFLGALVYALWPGNRDKFRRAARQPLDDQPPTAADTDQHPGETRPVGETKS